MHALLPHAVTARSPSRGSAGRLSLLEQAADAGRSLRQLPSLAGLLIDPENVIYDATLWTRWLRQLLVRMDARASCPEFFDVWDRNFRDDVDLGRRDYWDALREFLLDAGFTAAQVVEVFAAGSCRKQRFESDRRCLPGVRETLVRLAGAGAALVIVANTPRRAGEMLGDLEAMGLKNVFLAGVTSLDLGHAAPSAACFQQIRSRFGWTPSEAAFVASRARLLDGAARCGFHAIACNAEHETPAACTLERFSDLLHLPFQSARVRRVG